MSADELVTTCDADDRAVGSAPRARVRDDGLWHRTTSVLVRSTDGQWVYVHRRTDDKDVYPGMYDCWAGGVVTAGENPEDCANRELAEELGISGVPLTALFRFRFEEPPVRHHCYAFEARWDGPIVHQAAEIAGGQWMTLADLRAHLADPYWPVVPDGRAAIQRWFAATAGE